MNVINQNNSNLVQNRHEIANGSLVPFSVNSQMISKPDLICNDDLINRTRQALSSAASWEQITNNTKYLEPYFLEEEKQAIALVEQKKMSHPDLEAAYQKYPAAKKALELAEKDLSHAHTTSLRILFDELLLILISEIEQINKCASSRNNSKTVLSYKEENLHFILDKLFLTLTSFFLAISIQEDSFKLKKDLSELPPELKQLKEDVNNIIIGLNSSKKGNDPSVNSTIVNLKKFQEICAFILYCFEPSKECSTKLLPYLCIPLVSKKTAASLLQTTRGTIAQVQHQLKFISFFNTYFEKVAYKYEENSRLKLKKFSIKIRDRGDDKVKGFFNGLKSNLEKACIHMRQILGPLKETLLKLSKSNEIMASIANVSAALDEMWNKHQRSFLTGVAYYGNEKSHVLDHINKEKNQVSIVSGLEASSHTKISSIFGKQTLSIALVRDVCVIFCNSTVRLLNGLHCLNNTYWKPISLEHQRLTKGLVSLPLPSSKSIKFFDFYLLAAFKHAYSVGLLSEGIIPLFDLLNKLFQGEPFNTLEFSQYLQHLDKQIKLKLEQFIATQKKAELKDLASLCNLTSFFKSLLKSKEPNEMAKIPFVLLGLNEPVGIKKLTQEDVSFYEQLFKMISIFLSKPLPTLNLSVVADENEEIISLFSSELQKEVKDCETSLSNFLTSLKEIIDSKELSIENKMYQHATLLSQFDENNSRGHFFKLFVEKILALNEYLGKHPELYGSNSNKDIIYSYEQASTHINECFKFVQSCIFMPSQSIERWVENNPIESSSSTRASNTSSKNRKKLRKKAESNLKKEVKGKQTFIPIAEPIQAVLTSQLAETPILKTHQELLWENFSKIASTLEVDKTYMENVFSYYRTMMLEMNSLPDWEAPYSYGMASLLTEALLIEQTFKEAIKLLYVKDDKLNKNLPIIKPQTTNHALIFLWGSYSKLFKRVHGRAFNFDTSRITLLHRAVDKEIRYPALRSTSLHHLLNPMKKWSHNYFEGVVNPKEVTNKFRKDTMNAFEKTLVDMTKALGEYTSSSESSSTSSSLSESKNEIGTKINESPTSSQTSSLVSELKAIMSLIKSIRNEIKLSNGKIKSMHSEELNSDKLSRQNEISYALINLEHYTVVFQELVNKQNQTSCAYTDSVIYFLFMALFLEQSAKIVIAYENIPDPLNIQQHIFSGSDTYLHNHDVADLIQKIELHLLNQDHEKSSHLAFTQEEKTTCDELRDVIGQVSRYPAGKTGAVVKVLKEMRQLSIYRNRLLKQESLSKEDETECKWFLGNDQGHNLQTIEKKIVHNFHTQVHERLKVTLQLSRRMLDYFLAGV